MIELQKTSYLDHTIRTEPLHGDAFTDEQGGHKFIITCYQHGERVNLTGTISGRFMRPGGSVALTGSVSNGQAIITLSSECYQRNGGFLLTVFNTVGNDKFVVYACTGNVRRSKTDPLIDGGEIIDSVEDLIADIQTATAQIPVNYNASFAPAYSTTSSYAVGDYVTNNGNLYRCTTAITSGETWNSAHWTQVALANDVADLKSAVGYIEDNFETGFNQYDGTYYTNKAWIESGTATLVDLTGYTSTGLIPVGTTTHKRFRSNQRAYVVIAYDSNKQFVRKSNYYAFAVQFEQNGYVAYVFETQDFNSSTLMIAYTDETGGATTDTWNTLFPNQPYEAYKKTPKLADDVDSVDNLALTAYPDYFTNAKMANNPTYADCNTIPPQTVVLYSGATNLLHKPTTFTDGYIITYNYKGTSNGGNENFSIQYAHSCGDSQNTVWYRAKYANWTEWMKVPKTNDIILHPYRGLKNFTVLGDSISVGLCYTTVETYYQVTSWATIMANSMNATAVIYAQGGRTTAQMIASDDYSAAVANANGNQFAVIALGINDMNTSVDSTTFKENYTQLINDMLTNHDFVLCCTIPDGLQGSGRSAYNNDIISVAGAINNAFILDVNAYSDQIAPLCYLGHMSSTGYAALASVIEKCIDDLASYDNYFLHGTVDE